MDWLLENLWYGPANVDDKMSENVQNIQQKYKLHHKCHGKLEDGIDSGR